MSNNTRDLTRVWYMGNNIIAPANGTGLGTLFLDLMIEYGVVDMCIIPVFSDFIKDISAGIFFINVAGYQIWEVLV